MSFLISDPSFTILVIMVPSILEISIKIGWNFSGAEPVGSLKSGTRSELGIILHKKFLTSLVA
jgi:hypothetical protein